MVVGSVGIRMHAEGGRADGKKAATSREGSRWRAPELVVGLCQGIVDASMEVWLVTWRRIPVPLY